MEEVQNNRASGIFLLAAALLIGLGIFLFISSHWDDLGSLTRLIIILAVMLVTYLLAFKAEEKQYSIKIVNTLFLLGTLIYGGGIYLMFETFNINVISYGLEGLALWLIGAILIAVRTKARSIMALSIILGIFLIFRQNLGDSIISILILSITTLLCLYIGIQISKANNI